MIYNFDNVMMMMMMMTVSVRCYWSTFLVQNCEGQISNSDQETCNPDLVSS